MVESRTLIWVDEDLTVWANVFFLSEGILNEVWRVYQVSGEIALRDLRVVGIELRSIAKVAWLFSSHWNVAGVVASFGLLEVLLQGEIILFGICLQSALKFKQNSIRLL